MSTPTMSSARKLATNGSARRATRTLMKQLLLQQDRATSTATATATAAILEEPEPTTPEARTIAELPGPYAWPILGNLPLYLKPESKGRLHEVLTEQHEIHGKMFKVRLCGMDQVHISDPNLVETVMRHEGKYPIRPPFNSWKTYRRVTGKPLGIFSGEGAYWKRVRSTLNEKIMRPKPVLEYTPQLNTIAQDMVDKIRTLRTTHTDEELSGVIVNEFYKWSMESVGSIVFNTRMGCLEPDIPPRVQEFIDAIDKMMSSSIPIIAFDEWHRRLNSRFWRRHKEAWDKIFEIGKSYIDEHVQNMERRLEAGEAVAEKGELLSYLLCSRNMNREEVYANVTELMLAGVDTTSNTLSFILHLLATHPGVQERLQDEVHQVLAGAAPTQASVQNMRYLKCVLREATRLYPVITMNCRVATEDMVIGGYKIPKDTVMVMNHHAACRSTEVFENADSFTPERWLRYEGNTQAHPFASLPFGFGSRSCVGTKIAKLELCLALSNITQQFDLKPLEGVELKPFLRTILTPGNNLPVRFVDR